MMNHPGTSFPFGSTDLAASAGRCDCGRTAGPVWVQPGLPEPKNDLEYLASAYLGGAPAFGPSGAGDPDEPGGAGQLTKKAAASPRLCAIDLLRCRVVWRLVCELFDAAFDLELSSGMARRRPRCHMRQIAMYLSHVVLSVPYGTIAAAFGRDRSTVAHACAVVEDRRDDRAYDRFVERCERCVNAVFQPFGHPHAE